MQKYSMGTMSLSKLSYILILFVSIQSMEQKLSIPQEITLHRAAKILCLLRKNSFNSNRPFKCTRPGCYADFSSKMGLKSHIKNVHDCRKKIACTELNCTARFRNSYYLRRHKALKHSEERPFICPQCNSGFKLKQYLVVHLERIHKITQSQMQTKN